ncbi:MAG TPA: BamA/TamA family outer membrane protein, partial [Magnetospirillaceae bacterium]|nr:BamA/TamA family outer membrane protein [Magnetospirillaceae bacterium]
IPVGEEWSLKWVLGAHTGLSVLLPKPGVDRSVMDQSKLYIDGFFIGRGWRGLTDESFGGTLLWGNWVEVRMPLVERLLSLDMFLDAVTVLTDDGLLSFQDSISGGRDPAKTSLMDLGLENLAFSLGIGFRFTIPQFPFRFYFARRFVVDGAGRFTWASEGMEFVISISQMML